MKKTSLLLLLTLVSYSILAQSKKEIIEDSLSILHSKYLSSTDYDSINVSLALGKAKSKWEYFMDEFSDVKYIIKDSLNKICNDDRCVSFLLTNGFLVVSYRINDVVEFDTQIFNLKTTQDLLSNSKSRIYVEDFDKKKNVLLISSEGYGNNGRYWQYGTWSFKDKNIILGKKEY